MINLGLLIIVSGIIYQTENYHLVEGQIERFREKNKLEGDSCYFPLNCGLLSSYVPSACGTIVFSIYSNFLRNPFCSPYFQRHF